MVAPRGAPGEEAGLRSFLAYEHVVGVRMPAAGIDSKLKAAQTACNEGRFGECVVLNVQQQGGDYPSASLGMRIVPTGVEPMVALASEGADIGQRSTRAEDLAVAVHDNELSLARLRNERERLQEFQSRRDLAVADMIALSRQVAEVESQLEAAEQQGAQHRRRIDTQLLTLNFQPPSGQSNRNDIVVALRESGGILAAGVAWTIRAFAFLLPIAVLVAGVVFWIRRRRRRRETSRGP
ncbi:DUF4349 domain-containing protein [Luteimonas aestuarii]|nr:DUF4349 domain-containing protein [Luteimonas aestuarii]